MKKVITIVFLALTLTLSAKIDISQFKKKIILEGQEIFISKAEIIVNKMPTIGPAKNRNYIIVTLKTGDGKKIKAKYTMETLSFPDCTRHFSAKVKEKRGDSCVVRGLPSWAGKGILTVLELKDAKGKIYSLRADASVTVVH